MLGIRHRGFSTTRSPAAATTTTSLLAPHVQVGETSITASLSASRTTVVAPEGVEFDASGTTVGGWSAQKVWHNTHCVFSFGTSRTGTYPNGDTKNGYTGAPLTAAMYDTPGTFTASVTVTKGVPWAAAHYYVIGDVVTQAGSTFECVVAHFSGTFSTDHTASRWTLLHASVHTSTASVDIVAQDPDVVFPGSNTIVISASGDFTGAPSGATQRTTLPTWSGSNTASGSNRKRVLFRAGEDHRSLGTYQCASFRDDDVHVGSFGSGAKPIVERVTFGAGNHNNTNDWPSNIKIAGLAIRDGIEGTQCFERVTIYNNDLDAAGALQNNSIMLGEIVGFMGREPSPPRQIATSAFFYPRQVFVFENFQRGSTENDNTPPVGSFLTMQHSAFIGNDYRGADEHNVRLYLGHKVAFQCNRLQDVSSDGVRLALKHMGFGFQDDWSNGGILPASAANEYASTFNVFGRNWLGASDSNNNYTTSFGPQNRNPDDHEGMSDLIIEYNDFVDSQPTKNTDIILVGRRLHTRYNTGDVPLRISTDGISPTGAYDDVVAAGFDGPHKGQSSRGTWSY